MSASANKVQTINVFEAIVWSQMEHLAQRVRQIESGAAM
jgi:hypothetical protein